MLLQAITIRDQRYEQARRNVDFIQRYIFPGGALPSLQRMLDVATQHTDLNLLHMEDFGEHYARTLRLWHENFRQARGELERHGYDEQFYRLWSSTCATAKAAFSSAPSAPHSCCWVNRALVGNPSMSGNSAPRLPITRLHIIRSHP